MHIASVAAKLIIKHSEINKYGLEDFKSKGEFVESELVEHETCPGVKKKKDFYKFYILEEDGSETEETATIETAQDISFDTNKFCNINETWICSSIYVR